MMGAEEVNIPLLRKAVEWAEAEAAKPKSECLWVQDFWMTAPDSTGYGAALREGLGLTAECGTTYCIAGFVCEVEGLDITGGWATPAAEALGLPYDPDDDYVGAGRLFCASNSIEDVRRIAESLAGERL